MIVNMSEKATEQEINHVIERIREAGYTPHVTRGTERAIVAAVGSGRRHEIEALQVAPGVDNVVPIAQPFKLVVRAQPARPPQPHGREPIAPCQHRESCHLMNVGINPNLGPQLLLDAGIPVIDGVGPDVMVRVADGTVVRLDQETDCGDESCRNQERQECLWSGRQQGCRAKHHSTQDKNEENLIRQMGLRI